MNALVYVDIDQGIYKVKLKVALNEKRKKLRGFSFSINMANFEAFCWTKKLTSNLFFLKSDYVFEFDFLILKIRVVFLKNLYSIHSKKKSMVVIREFAYHFSPGTCCG